MSAVLTPVPNVSTYRPTGEAVPMAYQVIEVLMNYKRTVQVRPNPLLLC